MKVVQFGEFGSHEFAGIEFAADLGDPFVNAVFLASGSSSDSLVGNTVIQGLFTGSGSSQVNNQIQKLINTVLSSSGQATANLLWDTYVIASLSSGGQSSLYLEGRGQVGGIVNWAGTSATDIQGIEYAGFDILSRTELKLLTANDHNVVFNIIGEADFQPNFALVDHAIFDIAGKSIFLIKSNQYQNIDLISQGLSGLSLTSQRYINSLLKSNGNSIPNFNIQSIHRSDFNSIGTTTLVMPMQVVVRTTLNVIEDTYINFDGQLITQSGLNAVGLSELLWKVGSPVYAALPPAWFSVTRPEEIRGVIRPAENRLSIYKEL